VVALSLASDNGHDRPDNAPIVMPPRTSTHDLTRIKCCAMTETKSDLGIGPIERNEIAVGYRVNPLTFGRIGR